MSEQSLLSFSFSRFLNELHLGKLSETVIVHGNAPHNRRRTTPSIAVFWTNLRFFGQPMVMAQKSGAAICALMSTQAKLAVSALSVLPKPRIAIVINIIVAVGICARNSIIFPLLGDLGRRTGSLRAVGDPDGDAYARCTHACVAEGWKRVHKITSLAVACLTI